VKLEAAQEWGSKLEHEYHVYRATSGIRGIPKMLWYGVEGRYNVMVLSRLGCTFEEMVLRPLSYLGAARPLMLPLFRLLPYLYLPDRSTAYTGLTSAVAAISMLSSYRPNTSTSVRTMPTFLFRLAFPRLSNHSLASCYESSPVFLVRVSQFFGYLLRLFCYLLSTILRISQPISKLLTHLLTVL
jgi:hypothetical protein